MGKALDRYLGRVAALGCIVCDEALGIPGTPAQLHHPRTDAGGARRSSDYCVIPICPEHHTGSTGYHTLGPDAFFRRFKLTEMDMLGLVIERLNS